MRPILGLIVARPSPPINRGPGAKGSRHGRKWRLCPTTESPRLRRRDAVLFVLLVIAFGWGTAVAAAWEAPTDMYARGVWIRHGVLSGAGVGKLAQRNVGLVILEREASRAMAENSAIEWTDATWNPVTGCTKISAGCDNCYAARFSERFRGVPGHPFEPGFYLTLRPERLKQPLESGSVAA